MSYDEDLLAAEALQKEDTHAHLKIETDGVVSYASWIKAGQSLNYYIWDGNESAPHEEELKLKYLSNGRIQSVKNATGYKNNIDSVMNHFSNILNIEVSAHIGSAASSVSDSYGYQQADLVFARAEITGGGDLLANTFASIPKRSDSRTGTAIFIGDSMNGSAALMLEHTLRHEVLHGIGLYDAHIVLVDTKYDNLKYTATSYNSHGSFDTKLIDTFNVPAVVFPTSLMLLDYLALKEKGLLSTYDPKDEYYWSKDEKVLHTIYDTGGKDVISAQDHERNTIIDLREGHFSSYGKSDKSDEVPVENLAIAYGTVIENAIGGSGHDVLIGNTTGNELTGGDGNDILYGDGSRYNPAEWQFSGEHQYAYLATIDNSAFDLEDKDTLKGGDGNDHLFGMSGDDVLDGGEEGDVLEGGEGKDTYNFDGNFGRDIVIDGDGDGTIVINGITLNKFEQVDGADIIYRDDKNNPQFEIIKINEGYTTSLLILPLGPRTNSGSVIVKNWSQGNLNLQLSTPEPEAPDMTGIITLNGNSSDNSISYANYMEDHPDYNLADYRGLSVDGKEGHDLIMGFLQGNDTLLGGDGDDVISGGFTTHIGGGQLYPLLENTGKDSIDGGKGDDFIVVSAQGSVAHGGDDNDALSAGYAMYTTTSNVAAFSDVHAGLTRDQVWSDIRGLLDFEIKSEYANDIHTSSIRMGIFNDISNDYREHVGASSGEKFILGLNNNAYSFTYNYGADNGSFSPIGFSQPLFHFFAPIKPADGHDLAEFANVKGANLYGDKGEDKLAGGIYSDYLSGGDDADVLMGRAGHDILDGGEGADQIFGDEGNDIILGGAGNDTLVGSYTSLREGALDDDIIYGGDGDDVLEGGIGNDFLDGGAGIDEFYGGKGNDTIVGTAGELAAGGGGDDIYIVDFAVIPQANKNTKAASLAVSSTQSTEEQTPAFTIVDADGSNTLALVGVGGLENIALAAVGNDLVVQQNGGGIYIQGGLSGAISQIVQGSSVDAIATGNTTSNTSLNNLMLNNLASSVTRTASTSGAELVGGLLSDTLTAHADGSILIGGRGNDVLMGGLGNDIYVLRAGDGQDTLTETGGANKIKLAEGITAGQVSLRRSSGNLMLMVTAGESMTVSGMFNASTGAVIENKAIHSIEFSDGNIWDSAQILLEIAKGIKLVGTDQSDTLRGFDFGDTLDGGLGNDVLYGRDGDDVLLGAEGHDTLLGEAVKDILEGGNGNDSLVGDEGNDTLSGFTGMDTLNGGYGSDTFIFGKGDGLDIISYSNSRTGDEDVLVFKEGVTPVDIKLMRYQQDLKIIIASTGDSVSITNYFHDPVYQSVKKIIFKDNTQWDSAYIAAHLIVPTAGNDVLIDDSGSNSWSAFEGDDLLIGNAGNDQLDGGGGSDTLIGGLGDDSLYGGSGDDTYEFNLGDGKDGVYEERYSGNPDVIVFGAGISESNIKFGRNQSNLVLSIGELGDQITISNYYVNGAERFDQRKFELKFVDGVINLQDLHNRVVIDSFPATEGKDTLYGTPANDRIDGLADNDYIFTGVGNDTLIGGLGNDFLSGGEGVDTFFFNVGDGHDSVRDGDESKNEHNDIFFGHGISRTTISFGRTSSSLVMFYGSQDDQIVFESYFDNNKAFSIHFEDSPELSLALHDLFLSSNTRILAPTDNSDNISGFDGNDIIYGLAGGDRLYGEGGEDTLVGGAGNDTLWGGSGFNTFVFNQGDGSDSIRLYGSSESPWGVGGKIVFGEDILRKDLNYSFYNTSLVVSYGSGNQIAIDIPELVTDSFGPDEEDELDAIAGWEVEIEGQTASLSDLLDAESTIASSIRSPFFNSNYETYYGTSWNEVIDRTEANKTVYINASSGNDVLIGGRYGDGLNGGAANDTLNGGLGNDSLYGNDGDDVYLYQYGSGNDEIDEGFGEKINPGYDRVEFGTGILPDEVIVTRSNSSASSADGKGADLALTFTNGQFLKIKDVFTLNSGHVEINNIIEEFKFSNNDRWTFEQALNRIAGGDLIAPQAPAANFASSGAIIHGKAESGSLVEAKNASGIVLGSATANATDGAYNINLFTALINNETVRVTAKDTAGNVSDPTVINAPDYTAPAAPDGTFFPDPGRYISGSAEEGSYVEARSTSGELLGRSGLIAAGDGAYSIFLPVKLANGEVVKLAAIDVAGNISSVKTIVAPDSVAPLPPSAAFDLTGKVITGVAEAGSTVIVKNSSGVELKNTSADAITGAYSITLTTALINKETVNITAKDTAGNISAVKAIVAPDKTPPALPTASFDTAGKVISGVAEAGSAVVVKNANNTSTLGTITAHATNGAYSVTLTTALINKETVNITATDAAGNVSVARAVVAPDGTVPTPASIIIQAENYTSMSGVQKENTTDVGVGQNVGFIDTGDWMAYNNAAFNVPAEGRYKVTYRVASLNGGGRLTLKELSNDSVLGSVTIPKTGTWQTWVDVTQEITLTSGTHNFKLAVETGGFNFNWFKLEPVAATGPATPDTTPPAAPTANLDTAAKIVNGVAEAGSNVTVKDSAGQTLGVVQANAATGAYSVAFTQTLINGQSIFTTATDAAGNISAATATPIIINTNPQPSANGLRGSYYGYQQSANGNVDLSNIAQVRTLIANKAADASFTAKDFRYGVAGANELGMGTTLQTFLKADAASLTVDPANTSDAILRFDGKIKLDAGNYNFRVRADDGYSILVNGAVVAEHNANQAATTRTHTAFTVAQSGLQDIEIVYWDAGGGAFLNVELANTTTGAYNYLNQGILFQPDAATPAALMAQPDFEAIHYFNRNDALIQAMASFAPESGMDARYRSASFEQNHSLIAVGS
jgi:Ca2+-binding RTX toxin-like protein